MVHPNPTPLHPPAVSHHFAPGEVMKARPVGRSEKAQLLKRSLGYPAQHVCTNETPIEQYEWGVNQGEMEEIGVIGEEAMEPP